MFKTRNELISHTNRIISTVKSFCSDVKKNIDELSGMKSDFESIKQKNENYIIAEDIITNSTKSIESILKIIDEIINSSNSAITKSISECNTYISELETNYNSNLKEGEDRISLSRASI